MKRSVTLIVLTGLISLTVSGQDITGAWGGILKMPGLQLRLVLHINKAGDGYASTMDSPDQGAKGIPVTSTSFENATLKVTIANLEVEYEGVLSDSIINGNFEQHGQPFPLSLSRAGTEVSWIRPQKPVKPYPYYQEEVTFENKGAAVKLAGTLTLPEKEGSFPAVILISGSGPQNRDEELMGHKPFLVLSDFLTRNGIAVLRFDDRGVGASSGEFKTATSLDFSKDVEAGIEYLKARREIDKTKIGLIGHSEGGLIASMVAADSEDVAFVVLLAGPGVPGDKVILAQQKLIGSASGIDQATLAENEAINKGAFEIVKRPEDTTQLKVKLTEYLEQQQVPEKEISSSVGQLISPWMRYFLQYDPATSLGKVKCPVLALNGSKDLQVSPKENLAAIKAFLAKGGNNKATVKELPGLNHLFQECKTGLPAEYSTIEQTFSPIALNEILEWVQEQVK